MAAKHTPGEWIRDGRAVYALNDEGTNRMYIAVMCDGDPGMDSEEVQLANACLVEIAPKLLDACKRAKQVIETHGLGPWAAEPEETHRIKTELLERLQAAIVEAEADDD
jgi:hypothetical protein